MQNCIINNKLRVSGIQNYCVNDGPGVRTVIFFKGCFLSCPWCCNPEAINYNDDLIFDNNNCRSSRTSKICSECEILSGVNLKTDCPFGAFSSTYEDYNIEDLSHIILRDRDGLRTMGGVTLSGGEPFMQAEPLVEFCSNLKANDINIATETSLYCPQDNIKLLIDYIDYWIIDLKFQFGYFPNKNTIGYDIDVYKNLDYVQAIIDPSKIIYRLVIMNEMFINVNNIIDSLKQLDINNLELLIFHSLARSKYRKLGKNFRDFTKPETYHLDMFKNFLTINNINYKILSI